MTTGPRKRRIPAKPSTRPKGKPPQGKPSPPVPEQQQLPFPPQPQQSKLPEPTPESLLAAQIAFYQAMTAAANLATQLIQMTIDSDDR